VGNIFNNTIFSGITDFIAMVCSAWLVDKIKLKASFISCYCFSAVGSIIYLIFAESNPSVAPVLLLLAKLGISATFNLIYISNA